ncbi:MAG TPA: 30S ribosomal protein S6, partial [Solirubrobacteraceae bacterium]
RPLTYPIEKKGSAEYHLMQFHVSDGELLDGLDHTLRITDGLLRFRIIKLNAGTPDAPDMRAGQVRREAPAEGTAPVAEAPAEAAAPEAPVEESAPAAETVDVPAAEAEPETPPAAEEQPAGEDAAPAAE